MATVMRPPISVSDLLDQHNPGWALDQRFYVDSAIYQLELDRIVMRHWIMAGHISEISEPGDFLVQKVANESAIIVRTSDNSVRAFANVCRHRGSLICLEPSGSVSKFECPYHGWTYDIDGNLTAARSMGQEFDKATHGLHPVSLEIVGGFVFVCFDKNPPLMAGLKKDLCGPLAMFDTENLKVAARKTYPIAANWKLAIENYMECYHCANAHPDYARMHTLMLDPKRRDRIQDKMIARFDSCGIQNIEIDRSEFNARSGECGYSYSRTALFEEYLSGTKDGSPVAPLLGQLKGYDGGASDIGFGPFTFLLAYSDHIVGYVFSPVDAGNCKCEVYWFVRSDSIEGQDFDLKELMWLWDTTTYLDEKIIVNNWKGVNSRFYQPGPFSRMEDAEKLYTEWIVRELRHRA